jgi:DNA replication protein DnaT
MSSRILTTSIAGIDAFMRDPRGVLTHAEGGTLAVFADNAPAFYAITPERLAQLLEIEARLSRPASDVTLDNQFFDEPGHAPVAVPMGKFALYAGWQPDADFQRQAALWGIALTSPQPRKSWPRLPPGGRQKANSPIFSGSKSSRAASNQPRQQRRQPKRDINAFSEPDKQIPNGFRGAK